MGDDTPIPVADVEDGNPPEDLKRRPIPAYSQPPAPAVSSARPIPVGSPEELESRVRPPMARPIPITPQPVQPEQSPYPATAAENAAPDPNHVKSGIASLWANARNISHPVPRVLAEIGAGLARGLDVVGQGVGRVIPAVGAVESAIPGTTMNAQAQERTAEKQAEQQAALSGKQATTKHTEAETAQIENPQPKEGLTPEETTIHDLMAGENGQPRLNPETQQPYTYLDAYQAVNAAKGAKPESAGKTITTDKGIMQWNPSTSRYDIPAGGSAKTEKPDTPEQQFIDSETAKGIPLAKAIHDYAVATQKPEQPQKPQQQLAVVDGKVVELKPGMDVPEGTQSLTGDLHGSKATPDEQRRADLAENLNENLGTLEELANRRPDLFGPVAGRITAIKGFVGSDDPDIGTLETIKHQIGMAQISAHGMRSAQGVAGAAESIMNSFKNGPDAVKASVNAARNSVKTFTEDVAKNTRNGAPSQAKQGVQAQPSELKPPKEADPGMKWQHRTVSGKTEWRQVAQ